MPMQASLSASDGAVIQGNAHQWNCWACKTRGVAMQGGSTLVLAFGFEEQSGRPMRMKKVRTSLRSYGHIWAQVETFYRCVVNGEDSNGTRTPERLMLPAEYRGGKRPEPALAELQVLFGGPELRLERSSAVPICEEKCCSNGIDKEAVAPARVAQLRVPFHGVSENLPTWGPPVPWRLAMRSTVWRNLGVEAMAADTALFCLNTRSTNARRIAHEESVENQLRLYFAERQPALRFVAQQLDQLSYSDEIRLVRRSRVFISLFGSALHNCRFLPPDALVVEIRGAMKDDIGKSDVFLYASLCAQSMGLRWVGYAVNGSSLTSLARSSTDAWFRTHKASGYFTAHVDSSQLIEVIDAALRGEWGSALAQWAAAASKGEPNEANHRYIRRTLGKIQRLPQYLRRRSGCS
tara:strand:+ start:913 stop:2133 length:1221 start_codon:yes stop_codon:yes gene_type:complete